MAGAMAGTAILNSFLTETLHTVTLTVNNSCNLSCPHCYLQYEPAETHSKYDVVCLLTQSEFSHLAIVGKEPFVDSVSIKKCEALARSASSRGKTTSVITNGVNLTAVGVDLIKNFTYIDLSLDGGPKTYQLYRKASLNKITSGLDHLLKNGFSNVNALHVLSSQTIGNIDDMMKVRELFDFRQIMFSPYLPTLNYGSNTANRMSLEAILQALSECESFVNASNAFLLLSEVARNSSEFANFDIERMAAKYGLESRIRYVREDPLLYGIIRVTYDGYALTPFQSLHTIDYRKVGIDLSKLRSSQIRLEDIYRQMRLRHANSALCN
jgi:MoaA/NifB/PqqE/SkfB family radical SAM enzyme